MTMMETVLANLLKGLGVTPAFIQEKSAYVLDTVQATDARMKRIETMLVAICDKLEIPLDGEGRLIDLAPSELQQPGKEN